MMNKTILITFHLVVGLLINSSRLQAQESSRMYRIAKITVDSNHLSNYRKALQEQMQTAIQQEPGVLLYTALANKIDATQITIIEVYASKEAYQSHIETPHFKKYKETVSGWVVSLELIDQTLIAIAQK